MNQTKIREGERKKEKKMTEKTRMLKEKKKIGLYIYIYIRNKHTQIRGRWVETGVHIHTLASVVYQILCIFRNFFRI